MAENNNLTIAEYYAYTIISQYHKEKNINFLIDIFAYCIMYSPLKLEYYWDILNAKEEHLTNIAYTIFKIQRNFEDIILTDDELIVICQFKIIKDNIRMLSYQSIEEIFNNTFGNKINIECYPEFIVYFIKSSLYNTNIGKALIKYNLLPLPINANILAFEINDKKYIFYPNPRNMMFNNNQAPENTIQNVIDGNYALELDYRNIIKFT